MITNKRTPWLFLLPYLILFTVFIIVPTVMAVGLSFTNYNAVQTPQFVGLTNYINLMTQDTIFLQYVLPNTILQGRTSLGEGCIVGPNARLVNAVIGPGAVVNMSQVADATLGPGATVGPYACLQGGTVLDQQASVGPFSQLQGTTLGQGASLEGLSYLGQGGLAARTRLEHGVVAAGSEPVQAGRNVQVGAGATLAGPVKLGDDSLVSPGSVITEDVPERALGAAAARQVNQKEYLQRRKKLK